MPRRLGRISTQVLMTFSLDGPLAATDWGAWYPLTTAQARAAIHALERRSLVDVAGWNNEGHRTYAITKKGEDAVDALMAPTEEAEQPE